VLPIYPYDTSRLWDHFSAQQLGINSFELLDKAGIAIAQELRKHLDGNTLVVFIAGKGNNGGDAIRAATYLIKWGYNAIVWSVLPQKHHRWRIVGVPTSLSYFSLIVGLKIQKLTT